MNIITQNKVSVESDAASGSRRVMIIYDPSIILLGIIIISSLSGIITILG